MNRFSLGIALLLLLAAGQLHLVAQDLAPGTDVRLEVMPPNPISGATSIAARHGPLVALDIVANEMPAQEPAVSEANRPIPTATTTGEPLTIDLGGER